MVIKTLKLTWIVLLVIIGIPIFSNAQTTESLFVHSPGSTEQSFALNDLNKITFTEQTINIHLTTSDSVIALPYNNISVLTFKSKNTGVTMVKKTEVRLYLETNNLIIESDTEIISVKLFNLQGALLAHQTLKSFSTTIPLSLCPVGIYIVQLINGQGMSVYKIIKQ